MQRALAAAHHLVTAAEVQAHHTAEAINQARNQATAQDQALLAKNPRRLTIHHHRFRLKRSLRKRQVHQALKIVRHLFRRYIKSNRKDIQRKNV